MLQKILTDTYPKNENQRTHAGVPPDRGGLHRVVRDDAAGGGLALHHAVAGGRPVVPGADGGQGPGLLPLLRHARHART